MSDPVIKAALRGLAFVAVLALPAAGTGQPLPTPRQFVDNLDLRCYTISNQPAPGVNLRLDHLNTVFVKMGLLPEQVTLQPPQDLCVPVFKNSSEPPNNVLPFIEWLDWKCYGITGPPLNLPLTLTQLNPTISGMFGQTTQVTVREPQQLCVPVVKSFSLPPTPPPPAVLALVQYLDVKCYRVDSPTVSGRVTLNHLNPLLTTLPGETVAIGPAAKQLCVPVEKNQNVPPTSVLPIIQYSDVLCYPITGNPLNLTFWLTHLDPVLLAMHLPPEHVPVTTSDKLCVPVAKNNMLPPGSP